MEIRRTLHPGQPDTGKYMDQYGESPVCIRYRYDAVRNIRLTTVELIAEERPWKKHSEKIPKFLKNEKQEAETVPPGSLNTTEFSQNQLLSVRIKYGEAEPGRLVKAAGGRWNREKKYGNFLTEMWRLSDCRTGLFIEDRLSKVIYGNKYTISVHRHNAQTGSLCYFVRYSFLEIT